MNGYDLSRKFTDFCFENPSQIKPNHYALYFFAIEHCNRLGWKKQFGLPTTMTMEAIGVRSYNTYINTFNDLVNFGFFNLVEKSRNQYSSNIIALSNFDKAHNKALDKALIKHTTKHCSITQQSIDSIIKQITNKQVTKKQVMKLFDSIESYLSGLQDTSIGEEQTFQSKKINFINWFNDTKMKYTNKAGKSKVLNPTDENNLKKLLKVYSMEDFNIAAKNLYRSNWAIENNMLTISHFVRIENFNKYLEQGDNVTKPTKAINTNPVLNREDFFTD